MTILMRMADLWQYRELTLNLVVRDLKVRYKNSFLGVLWSLINPLLMTAVFTVVFTVMMPNSFVENFPVFVLCGLLPWNFFAASIVGATGSIVGNSHLIKKVYFPYEVLPLSLVLSNLVNFMIALIVLFVMLLVFKIPFTLSLLFLPIIIITQIIFMLGVGLFLATVNVFYRDTQMIMEVLILAWFFLTPVFYPISILPRSYVFLGVELDVWRLTHILNPMASLVASYRDVLYYGVFPGIDFFARTFVTAVIVFAIGYVVFDHFRGVFGEEL